MFFFFYTINSSFLVRNLFFKFFIFTYLFYKKIFFVPFRWGMFINIFKKKLNLISSKFNVKFFQIFFFNSFKKKKIEKILTNWNYLCIFFKKIKLTHYLVYPIKPYWILNNLNFIINYFFYFNTYFTVYFQEFRYLLIHFKNFFYRILLKIRRRYRRKFKFRYKRKFRYRVFIRLLTRFMSRYKFRYRVKLKFKLKFKPKLYLKFRKKKRFRFIRARFHKRRALRPFFVNFKKKIYKFFSSLSKNILLFQFYFYYSLMFWRWSKHRFLRKMRLNRWKRKRIKRRLKLIAKFQLTTLKFIKSFFNKNKHIVQQYHHLNHFGNVYYPTLFLKQFKLKLYFWRQRTLHLNLVKFLSIFMLNFLESQCQSKFFIILKFFKNKRLMRVLRRHLRKAMFYQFKIGAGFFIKEMFYIIWLSFKMKDILFLVLWIKRTMERIRWRKQKIFLSSLRFILRKCISPYLMYLRCLGYRCVIWGKIGVSGNSKTRNFICRNKIYSLTTKTYKTSYEFVTINTFTGVLGLSFYLVF